MSRRKPAKKPELVLFNVTYQDGSMTSNRRVPGDLVGGLDGEAPIMAFIEAQDREIGERSGRPRAPIKSIERADDR